MTGLSRREFLAAIAAVTPLALAACSSGAQSASSSASSASASADSATDVEQSSGQASGTDGKHVIGVAVYNPADNEVIMFKDYLVKYIAGLGFDDVQFIYSGAINTEDELLAFIDDVADQGGEGIMSFINIDLGAEVERCASHGMYHIVASGTVSDEDFMSVEDNEYFLGTIGPGIQMEYIAGTNMVLNYIAHKAGDKYFVMSGGASLGNEMHYQRTLGILDALETGYGVNLGNTIELAATTENKTISVEDVVVTISPGYVAREGMKEPVEEAFKADSYNVVLSSLPVAPIIDVLNTSNAQIAQVDCYSEENEILFQAGKLNYLVGKYGSLVGPSFAAMYNAITGHASQFRVNGKAFKITQSMWWSASKEDFNEKFELAANATTPAYNLDDIYSVCVEYTPSVTMDEFRDLAQKSSFDDAKARRAKS